MTEPLDIPRFIKLTTKQELSRQRIIAWYHCVEQHAPSGTVDTVQTTNNEGRLENVRLVHRTTEDGHSYLVPLTRDLRASEVDAIVRAFAKEMPKLNFEVETNETKLVAQDHGEIPLDAARHAALCLSIAKGRHEDWVRERTDAGWRYGTKFNTKERTHPLILPWDQLPDRFRQPDMDSPQPLLTALNDHGYAVIPKDELDYLLGQVETRHR